MMSCVFFVGDERCFVCCFWCMMSCVFFVGDERCFVCCFWCMMDDELCVFVGGGR